MEFASEIDLLPEMLSFIREKAALAGVSKESMNKLELASEEALVNVISYAYPNKVGPITIECHQEPQLFKVLIMDQGKAFNPIQESPKVNVNASISERKVGGLGIFLIKKMVKVDYEHKEGKNHLQLSIAL